MTDKNSRTHRDWRNSYGLLQIPSVYQSSRPGKAGLPTSYFMQLGQPDTHLKLLALPATSGFEWDIIPYEGGYSITTAKETGYATWKYGKVNTKRWDFTGGKQDKEIPGQMPGVPPMNFFNHDSQVKLLWISTVCQLAATARMTCCFFIAHCDTVVSVLTASCPCYLTVLPFSPTLTAPSK